MKINQVIKKALITEKTMALAREGKYTFVVDRRADKQAIKKTSESLFSVKVIKVRIINIKGKEKKVGRQRRQTIRKPDWKKAILELTPGQKIDIFEEIKKGS